MDIRKISQIDANYYKINREERNYAEAFGCMDLAEMPGFAVEMVKNVVYPVGN